MQSHKKWIIGVGVAAVAVLAYSIFNTTHHNPFHIGAATAGKSVWKTFKPQNGRFEVLLPSIPQHVTESHPNGNDYTKYDVYLSQDHDGNVYMISLTQYPITYDMGKVDEVLEAVKNGAMGSNSKNQLTFEEKNSYLNKPAMDFAIANNDSNIRSKVIIDDRTLIVLTVMNRDPNQIESDFKTFAGSFTLKNP
ncbi:MAG: hypothetical protein JSS12_05115, partial [Verrucomicrobia bacterium]|nr:hypothetical protein [Verrucomicrobiota bacterium]